MDRLCILLGSETYDNQLKYGNETFKELELISKTGWYFENIHHSVDVVCCCDWKAGACLEGTQSTIIECER